MTMDDWRTAVDRRLAAIDRRLNQVETQNAVDEVHRTNVETRLGSIESSLTWLVRLIIGAIVLALLAFILQGGTQ